MNMSWYDYVVDLLSAMLTLCLEIKTINVLESHKKISFNLKSVLVILFGSLMLLLNTYYVDSLSRSFMSIIIVYVCILLISNIGIINAFLYLIICNIFIALYESVLFSLLLKTDILSLEMFDKSHVIKALFSFLTLLLVYFTIKNRKVREIIDKLKNIKTKTINTIIVILLVFFCIALVLINFNSVESFSIKTYIGNIILIICLIVVISISIYNYLIIQKEENKTDILLKFMEKYEKVIEENRINNHELLNTLITLKTYNNKNSSEYDSLINEAIDKYNNKGIKTKNIYNLPSGLKGMFYYKLYGLDDKKYEITINESKNAIKSMKRLDKGVYISLYKIIGILLDNAIEAASTANKKYILIDIYDVNNSIIIEISNSFKGKVDINSINNKFYSTKGKKRGLGLYIMKSIVDSSNNIKAEQSVDVNNHIFISKIIVNKK